MKRTQTLGFTSALPRRWPFEIFQHGRNLFAPYWPLAEAMLQVIVSAVRSLRELTEPAS
jgi:hypothetical protein